MTHTKDTGKAKPAILLILGLATWLLVSCGPETLLTTKSPSYLEGEHWAEPLAEQIEQNERLITALEQGSEGSSVICIDTSGSIADLDLAIFVQHLDRTLGDLKAKPVILIGDTEVDWEGWYEGEHTFAPGSEAMHAAQWRGRGGTDFRPLIERALQVEPDVILYLTDGYGAFPEKIPEQEIIWLVNHECSSTQLQGYCTRG